MSNEKMSITRGDLEEIVDGACRRAVSAVFDRLGVDLTDKRAVEEFRQDLFFARKQRKGAEDVARVIRQSGVGALVCGLLWALLWGIQHAMGGGS